MRVLTMGALTALLFSVQGLSAQTVSLDLRGLAALPTEDLVDTELDPGFGFGAVVAVRVMPHAFLYGGWDWVRFTAETSFAGADRDFEETGYVFGARFEHPLGAGPLAYRLEAGGVMKHVEVEDGGGDPLFDSDHDLGFELGAGLVVSPADGWSVVPLVRFRSTTPELTMGAATYEGALRYIGVEVGLARRF